MRIEPGIWVAQCGRCRLALFQAGWSTHGCPCLTGVFLDAGPGPGLLLATPCAWLSPTIPRLLSLALLPPSDVATTASASGKGEAVLKPEGWSRQWRVPGCPRSPGSCSSLPFLPSAAILLLGPGVPSCPTPSCLRGWLPPRVPFPAARLGFLLAQRVPVLAGAGERSRQPGCPQDAASCPDRFWGLLLMAMPCVRGSLLL